MGSFYWFVNGVLWCIFRKLWVLLNCNFIDWIYMNVFESGKMDVFVN